MDSNPSSQPARNDFPDVHRVRITDYPSSWLVNGEERRVGTIGARFNSRPFAYLPSDPGRPEALKVMLNWKAALVEIAWFTILVKTPSCERNTVELYRNRPARKARTEHENVEAGRFRYSRLK
jgi:hypothetical protein